MFLSLKRYIFQRKRKEDMQSSWQEFIGKFQKRTFLNKKRISLEATLIPNTANQLCKKPSLRIFLLFMEKFQLL